MSRCGSLSDVVDARKIAAALTSRVFARPSLPLAPLRHSFRIGIPVPSAMTQTSGATPPTSSFARLSSFGKSRTASQCSPTISRTVSAETRNACFAEKSLAASAKGRSTAERIMSAQAAGVYLPTSPSLSSKG